MSAAGKAPAPKLERLGACGKVGSWSPGPGRRRVLKWCKCPRYVHSAELTREPWQPVCICGDTRAVHALVEVQS